MRSFAFASYLGEYQQLLGELDPAAGAGLVDACQVGELDIAPLPFVILDQKGLVDSEQHCGIVGTVTDSD